MNQYIIPKGQKLPVQKELSDEEKEVCYRFNNQVKLPTTKDEAKAMLAVSMKYLGIEDSEPHPHKELSDEEIDNLIIDKGHLDCVLDFHPTFDTVSVMRFELRRLARAIEERHGIK